MMRGRGHERRDDAVLAQEVNQGETDRGAEERGEHADPREIGDPPHALDQSRLAVADRAKQDGERQQRHRTRRTRRCRTSISRRGARRPRAGRRRAGRAPTDVRRRTAAVLAIRADSPDADRLGNLPHAAAVDAHPGDALGTARGSSCTARRGRRRPGRAAAPSPCSARCSRRCSRPTSRRSAPTTSGSGRRYAGSRRRWEPDDRLRAPSH